MAAEEGLRISEMPILEEITGREYIPVVDENGDNKRISTEVLSSGDVTVDKELSLQSENPVQNKVITKAVQNAISEYNVSKIHPTSGIDGSNKYTLETAIVQVPSEYRTIGIKCSFINEAGNNESWEYKGGEWVVGSFSEVGYKKLEQAFTQLSGKANIVSTEDVSETTKELLPGKYYIFGEVETLTLTLAAAEENVLAEYQFEFTSGTTPTAITDIEGVEWKGDTIEANKVYQASISRGIGILIGRAKE